MYLILADNQFFIQLLAFFVLFCHDIADSVIHSELFDL